MGKTNEIQKQTTMSYGDNAFTTTIKDDTVEFDSLKDKFTFKDEVEVPSLKINGEPITPGGGAQADWNQNDSNAEDFIKNRTHYVETGFAILMEDTFTEPYVQGIVYSFNAFTSDFEMEEGKTYRITMLGQEYILEAIETEDFPIPHVVYGDIEENPENPTPGSFSISANDMGFMAAVASETEIAFINIKIEGEAETVHQLDDKYISDNIARTADIPTQAFELDESNYNIVSKFTNPTNTISATTSLVASAPSVANMTVGGQANLVVTGSAASNNTLAGASNIIISDTNYLNAAGSNNIVISAYGSGQTVASSETASILIGGAGGVKLQNGGYQKTMIQPNYGAEINGDHSTIICGSGKVYGSNNTVISALSDSNQIYGSNNIITGGGNSFVAKIGDSTHQQNTGNSIIANANGTGTITDGAGNTIAFCQGGNFTISTGSTNTILSCAGSATISAGASNSIIGSTGSSTISGGSSNLIVGGSGTVTIPGTVTNCIVIGAATSSPTESNMVYVPALNAINGVKTKKITIAGIDPADEYMHSEIMDASSDVAFTRVLANSSSTKTDGYVEILYKATTGVTCSAYIDSTDVPLTADGGWHKLEQGCNPGHGVEIHINNSSPVTDATLEVISKVYYI